MGVQLTKETSNGSERCPLCTTQILKALYYNPILSSRDGVFLLLFGGKFYFIDKVPGLIQKFNAPFTNRIPDSFISKCTPSGAFA